MQQLINDLKYIDVTLLNFLDMYGVYIYSFLFLLIFLKTAFVVLTFIPGDAAVFISGALVSIGELSLFILFPLFIVATILGDSQNYLLGKIGKKVTKSWSPISKMTLSKASIFLESNGKGAILFARFVPLMRTSVPFICGYTGFPFRSFFVNNSTGAFIWVSLWLSAGLLLGQLPTIEKHMTLSLAIISCIPFLIPAIIFIIKKSKNFAFNSNS